MRVRVGDVQLYVDVAGQELVPDGLSMEARPQIVLVHGGPGSNDHSHYKPFMDDYAEFAQLIYYDHRGNGRSDRSTADKWNLNQWADDLRGLCDVLGVEHPIIFGASFGGMVAQAFAIRHPKRAAKIIFCGTSARTRIDRILDAMERFGGVHARQIAEQLWRGEEHDEQREAWLRSEYLKVCAPLYMRHAPSDALSIQDRTRHNHDVMNHFKREGGEFHTFDFLPGLREVRSECLVIVGEEDPITPVADALDLHAALPPGACLARIPDCGHSPYMDQPVLTRRIVERFILAPRGDTTC